MTDWVEFKKKMDAVVRKQELCDIAVPDLKKLEKMIKEGKCTYWECQEDIRNWMDKDKEGFLCKKAKNILDRILKAFGQVAGKRVEKKEKKEEQPDLKF